MKKRGISPLIATVLLIGSTIALAALVMVWAQELFKTTTGEQSEETELLMKCKEWLKRDGFICIAVPDCKNPEMLDASVDNPYHIFHFTKKSLKKIFKKLNFDLIECDSLANQQRTNRRIHKVVKKFGLTKISESAAPYYPFEITNGSDGYEIRVVLKLN